MSPYTAILISCYTSFPQLKYIYIRTLFYGIKDLVRQLSTKTVVIQAWLREALDYETLDKQTYLIV